MALTAWFHFGIILENRVGARSSLASPWTTNALSKPRYKRSLIAMGLALLVLGGLTIYDSSAASSYQSTFNILPQKFFKITNNLRDKTTITGQFQETSGRPVTFLIMNSVQFAAFQIRQGNASLFSLQDVTTASITFTFNTPDSYYLVFIHGSGLLSTTETVAFQRSYYNLSRFELISGVALIAVGVLEAYWGLRPRDAQPRSQRKQLGTPHGQP